jgi:transposase
VSQSELKRRLGWHGAKLGQVLAALKKYGSVIRHGDVWIKTQEQAQQDQIQTKGPLSLDEIISEFSKQDSSQIKIELDDANRKILGEIYSLYVSSKIRYCPRNNLPQISGLDKVLVSLADKELIVIERTSAFLTLKGLQACDEKWTSTKRAYAVLTAINDGKKIEDGTVIDAYVSIESICRSSGLYNWTMFSGMLNNFTSNDIVVYEARGGRDAKFYTLTSKGKQLLERLKAILDAPKPVEPEKPADIPIPAPAPEPPKPPVLDFKPFPEPPERSETEAQFFWGAQKIEKITIGDTTYKIVVVGEKGPLEKRINSAKSQGYIGLTNFEWRYLPQIAKYVTQEGLDIKKATSEIDLPKGRILNLLEKYNSKGIKFPEAKAPPAKPEIYNNCNEVLQSYKNGQQQQTKALESIVEIVTRWDKEMADLRKRIEKLEKKS